MSMLKRPVFWILGGLGYILGRLMSKERNLIILEGTDSSRYNESSRYLFEYLSTQKDLDVYWATSSRTIKDHISKKGLKCLFGFWDKLKTMPKAKMVIGTGSTHMDFFNVIGSDTLKYCLMHGIGPKASVYTGESEAPTMRELENIHKFDYMNFTSKYTASLIGKLAYKTPYKKIVVLGYPRNDQLFDKALCEKALRAKDYGRKVFPHMKPGSRLLLYTPTWRKDMSKDLPLFGLKGFDLRSMDSFLKENNIYMICTVHPNVASSIKTGCDNIFVVDYGKDHLFDTNALMPEADLLINDYSTTSTDFAILDRPQIFVMPDYDEYVEKDCFTEDYRKVLPGKEVFSFEELKKEILGQLEDPGQFSAARRAYLDKYYDVSLSNSCELHANFIRKVLGV